MKDLKWEYKYLLGELERYNNLYEIARNRGDIGQINIYSSMIDNTYDKLIKIKDRIEEIEKRRVKDE